MVRHAGGHRAGCLREGQVALARTAGTEDQFPSGYIASFATGRSTPARPLIGGRNARPRRPDRLAGSSKPKSMEWMLRSAMKSALERLPIEQREVIVARLWGKLSFSTQRVRKGVCGVFRQRTAFQPVQIAGIGRRLRRELGRRRCPTTHHRAIGRYSRRTAAESTATRCFSRPVGLRCDRIGVGERSQEAALKRQRRRFRKQLSSC